MTPRFNLAVVILLLVLGAPFYWLYIDNRPGDAQPKPVTIGQLRTLADSQAGPAPRSISMQRVASANRNSNWMAAGSGIRQRYIAIMAYRLEVPGSAPILINTGMTGAAAEAASLDQFYPRSQQTVDLALANAGKIVATGGGAEQLSGLAAHASPDLLGKLAITDAQLQQARTSKTFDWPSEPVVPSHSGGAPWAVAPGVVAIPTGIPERGSQMVYVRLADGSEYLFAGDVAPLETSWRNLRGRSRLRSQFYVKEDRSEAFAWLLTVRKLHREAPDMHILPGRDYYYLTGEEAPHRIARQFPER
ncbi:MAG: hypothetical protein KDE55_06470 [Novosphingobium sp.]|nr:hypothetical protein [Novosphingobium sp.]